jgi:A/G-specific adenine glycosylase
VAARGGEFPGTEAELRCLPGVGAYTAAAVAALAFDQRAVVVDANVERVVARLFALEQPLPGARNAIRLYADRITPDQRCGDFAQAMMDLGATVCTPRKPHCGVCPLAGACQARCDEPDRFPVKPAKRAKRLRHGRAYWIVQQGCVWLAQRPPRGMLGAMRALPDDGWSARADGALPPPAAGPWQPGGLVRHSFTHFDLELQLMLYSGPDLVSLPATPGEWWPLDRIDDAGLPTVFAKAARLALADT